MSSDFTRVLLILIGITVGFALIVAALVSTAIGVPVGIAAAHRPRLYAALRPVLDLMQTLPTFVYLIPTLVLFGLGVVPGLISTVIFALPAPIRLTQLGISSVPTALREAGQAFGATPMQLLWKVELPSAAPTILAGITQCIMLSLSMVVIAALVGAGGLGVPVVRALNTVQVGMGFEAGFVIVLLAIVLDRISRPPDKAPAPPTEATPTPPAETATAEVTPAPSAEATFSSALPTRKGRSIP